MGVSDKYGTVVVDLEMIRASAVENDDEAFEPSFGCEVRELGEKISAKLFGSSCMCEDDQCCDDCCELRCGEGADE